jgi:hypothetical protein
MKHQKEFLSKSMDRIFLSTEKLGFWDDKNSRIHSRLDCTKDWEWEVNPDPSDRYGVFTISLILLAKFQHGLDISAYEAKITAYLNYIKGEILSYEKSNITYGAFNALVLGQLLFENQGYDFKKEIQASYQLLKNQISVISNNEDSLALIGLSLYYKHINNDKEVLKYIERLVESLLGSQNTKGFFLTGDIRGVYHQRTMYTLWGLAFASDITHKKEIKLAIEKSIQHVWDFRRDGKDNAFLWHPLVYNSRKKSKIPLPILSPVSVNYLFECHQTFFANAVSFYQYFYKTEKFSDYRYKALDWIFGENRMKTNLVEITKIDIPARIMSRKGELFIKNNYFKGSYEVGSYIFALAVKD